MSTIDNVAICKSFYETFMRVGTHESVLDYFADDAVLKLTIPADTPLGGEFRGKEGLMTYFKRADAHVQITEVDIWEYIPHEDRVIVLGLERGLVRRTGATFESEWACLLGFRDGKIVKITIFEDTSALVEAFRLPAE